MSYILWPPELLDNPALVVLQNEDPNNLGLYMRCLQVASQAQLDGHLIIFGGRPLTAKSLSTVHYRTTQRVEECQSFIDLALDLGLLVYDEDEGCLQVAWWADFDKHASETKDAWRERKRLQRQRSKQARDKTETPCHENNRDSHKKPVTCHDPTNQPTNQPTNHPSSDPAKQLTPRAKRANGRPSQRPHPLPAEAAATLDRLRQHNDQADRTAARGP